MTTEKKPRAMTIKLFVKKNLSGKVTAEGYLDAERDFLNNYPFLQPILDAYDQQQLLPTPTLEAVKSALITHLLETESKTHATKSEKVKIPVIRKKKETSAEEDDQEGEETPSKAYTITLMCKSIDREGNTTIGVGTVDTITGYRIRTDKGDIVVDTKDKADGHVILEKIHEITPAEWQADDFGAAMRLADRRLFAREDSVHAVIRNNYGVPVCTQVSRGDAIARTLKAGKPPASRRTTSNSSSLKWVGRAKQDHSNFSRG
jgi:hypothetical protein